MSSKVLLGVQQSLKRRVEDKIGESQSISEKTKILEAEMTTHLIYLNKLIKKIIGMQEGQILGGDRYQIGFANQYDQDLFEENRIRMKEKIKKIRSTRYTTEYKDDTDFCKNASKNFPFGYSSEPQSKESSIIPSRRSKPLLVSSKKPKIKGVGFQLDRVSEKSSSPPPIKQANQGNVYMKSITSEEKSSISHQSPSKRPINPVSQSFYDKIQHKSKIIESQESDLIKQVFDIMLHNAQLPYTLSNVEITEVEKLEFIHKFVQRYH